MDEYQYGDIASAAAVEIEEGEASGIDGVARTVVVDQPRQMSVVPWALVELDDGSGFLVNLAKGYSIGWKQKKEKKR